MVNSLFFIEKKFALIYLFLNEKKMSKIQYLNIKFPFTSEDDEKYFVDLNQDVTDEVKSELLHLMFTPKGQKIRDPRFGTDLIKYIFQPSDAETWQCIKNDINETVSEYIGNIIINDINILKNEDDLNDVFVRIDYSVIDGNVTTKDTIITKI